MRAARKKAILAAAPAKHWGVVLGTLGRQGNPKLMSTLQAKLAAKGCHVTAVLLSEVTPVKLAALGHVEAWVQVACPRLSIDWGEGFDRPTLTPYEGLIALGEVPGWWEGAVAAPGGGGGGVGGNATSSSSRAEAVAGTVGSSSGCGGCRDRVCGGESGPASSRGSGSVDADAAGEGVGTRVDVGVGGCGDCSCSSSDKQRSGALPSVEPYPMDYYAKEGGPWNSSYHKVQSSARRPGGMRVGAGTAAVAGAAGGSGPSRAAVA